MKWKYLFVGWFSFLFSSLVSAAIPPASGKIHANGINIFYELKGQGSPLVLIAGFSCDHTFWSGIVDELAKHHQILLLDNRGIGQTDTPNSAYTIDLMADDVMAVVKALGLKKPIIVGQSMGSAMAQSIGKRYANDIDKIILMNTFDKVYKAPQIAFELTGKLHRMNIPLKYRVESIAPWVYSSEFLSQPNQLDKLIGYAEKNPYPQSLTGYENQLEALQIFNSSDWLHDIKVPTLIIAAEEDIIAPLNAAKEVAKNIGPQTKLMIVPGGHATPIEQPQKTIKAIEDFASS